MKLFRRVFLVLAIVLMSTEFILRCFGYRPGYLIPPDDKVMSAGKSLVDSLYLTKMFTPDSNGIVLRNLEYDTANFSKDFKYFSSVTYNKVYKYYAEAPINSEGFADIEFSNKDTANKKRVMLIGDSFTWGCSAQPISNSFANLIDANSQLVTYNLGAPGADLATYLKLVQTHLHRINPNYVIVNFFSNDFVDYAKELVPYEHADMYTTNAGSFYKQNFMYEGKDSVELFDTYVDAYQYFEQRYTYRGVHNKGLKFWIKNTRLFPQIYRLVFGYNPTTVSTTRLPKLDQTYSYMHEIDSLCKNHGAKLMVSIINNGNQSDGEVDRYYKDIFKDIYLVYPKGIDPINDFTLTPDGHFNNEGHKKYAEQLIELLLSKD